MTNTPSGPFDDRHGVTGNPQRNMDVEDLGIGEVYGPPTIGPAHARPVAPKKKRRTWPWVVLIVMGFLFVSCGVVMASANKAANTPVVVVPPPSQAIESPASVSASASEPVNGSEPSSSGGNVSGSGGDNQPVYGKSFGDGDWLVGVGKEIQPGTYRTAGAKDTGASFIFCAVIVSKDGSSVNSASTSGNNEPARIILKAGQTAKSQGCQTWQKVG